MENITHIQEYLYNKYPNSNQLSISRAMKLFYLIEWRYAITEFKKLTEAEWRLNQYGPFYSKFKDYFTQSDCFNVVENTIENKKEIIIKYQSCSIPSSLKQETTTVIDFVIEKCHSYSWSELNNLINSTYGIINTQEGHVIDVLKLAMTYKGRI